MLGVFCSAVFAGQEEAVPVDSAMYYDSVAVRLKVEADSLGNEASNSIGFGMIMTLFGSVATAWSFSESESSSLEGGGAVMVVFIVPSVCLLAGGVMGLAGGIGQNLKSKYKTKQSEESRQKAERFRTKTQQVKVDFVPLINPVAGMAGMNVAFRF